jgi:hypothetical protein
MRGQGEAGTTVRRCSWARARLGGMSRTWEAGGRLKLNYAPTCSSAPTGQEGALPARNRYS